MLIFLMLLALVLFSTGAFVMGRKAAVAAGRAAEGRAHSLPGYHGAYVALWAGAGRIVHSALGRGGVGGDHLFGDEPRMVRMRENLVGVRRL